MENIQHIQQQPVQPYSREFFQQQGRKGDEGLRKKLGKKKYLALKKKASSSRKKKVK